MTFKAYEIWEQNRYLYSVFPSDGNPFTVLEDEQKRHPRAQLVELENGVRTTVGQPLSTDDEILFEEWEDYDEA